MQSPDRDQPGPQQLQIRQEPGRGLREHRERGDLLGWQVVRQRPERRDVAVVGGDEFEYGAAARTESYGEGTARTPLGPQEQFRLGGPTRLRPGGVLVGRAASPCQFAAARPVPEVPVQVEPEASVGMRVGMVSAGAVAGPLPQGQ